MALLTALGSGGGERSGELRTELTDRAQSPMEG